MVLHIFSISEINPSTTMTTAMAYGCAKYYDHSLNNQIHKPIQLFVI
jgi:hypothetical protein